MPADHSLSIVGIAENLWRLAWDFHDTLLTSSACTTRINRHPRMHSSWGSCARPTLPNDVQGLPAQERKKCIGVFPSCM